MIRSALLVCLVATGAAAHGTFPQALSVNFRPGAPNDVLIGTNFGAVVSRDNGASWRSICEEGVGSGNGLRPAWFLSPSGSTFAGSYRGLFISRGDGCTWQSHPDFEMTGASDIQGQGGTLLATSQLYNVENRIMRSTDDGVTWLPTPVKSTTLFYSTVRFAPSNKDRAYAAAWWFQPNTSIILRSDDNGQTFTSKDLSTALPAAGAFYVLAVHPQKPEVVYATVFKDTEPRSAWLLKSIDSGETFATVITTTEVFGSVAFAANPSIVYAAAGNVLYRSTDEGQSFTPLLVPQKNACVATRGEGLYSCGLQELDGFAVGQGDGGAFRPLLRWGQISGPITCPAGTSVQALCEPLWPVVKATFPLEPDGGIPDAGTDGGVDPPLPKPGCGCTAVDGPLCLALVLWVLRRTNRASLPTRTGGLSY